jgi:hypothetical protein
VHSDALRQLAATTSGASYAVIGSSIGHRPERHEIIAWMVAAALPPRCWP